MRIEAERLIKQAERDLINAKKNIGIEAYEVGVFLAEQAVEKFLKAAWIQKKNELHPHTHYLLELAKGMNLPDNIKRHLANLNADYTITRYPDAANGIPYELYDHETALSKIRAAEEVIGWLKAKMKE